MSRFFVGSVLFLDFVFGFQLAMYVGVQYRRHIIYLKGVDGLSASLWLLIGQHTSNDGAGLITRLN